MASKLSSKEYLPVGEEHNHVHSNPSNFKETFLTQFHMNKINTQMTNKTMQLVT